MTREQAIEWMQRHFFYNGTTSPNVMERFSMDDFPWGSVTTSGTVQSGVTFTTAQLSGFGVKQVNYSFPRKLKMSSSTFTDVMVNLIWNGSGWLFTVTGGANPTIANWLNWNRNAVLSDGKSINLLENIEFVYNHDLDCTTHNGGFGSIKCGHRAIPADVLVALNLPSGGAAKMVLLKRLGSHDKYQSQPPTAGNIPDTHNQWYSIYEDSSRMEWWPSFSDAVTYTQIRKDDNYNVNHDYRDSNLYINEDNEYIKLRAPLYPNYNYAQSLNAQQKIPGYTASPCGTVPWPKMSIVRDGGLDGSSPCAGVYQWRGVSRGTASPCCPILSGLDFYGAPFSLTSMMGGEVPPYTFGGQWDLTNDASIDWEWGDWRGYEDGWGVVNTISISLGVDEFNLEMPCAIKPMAAYDFSKQCYNAGECDGDSYWQYMHKRYKPWDERNPNFERFYYTVGFIIEKVHSSNNKPFIEFLLPDGPRWIDKDDMPRLTGSNQIDWRATNQLWLDHLYILQGGISIHQYYEHYVVQVNHEWWGSASMTAAFSGGHGVPTNPMWAFRNLTPGNSPWYNHFKVVLHPDNGAWWRILAHYTTGETTLNTIRGMNSNWILQTAIEANNLQCIALVLYPKWFIDRLS